MLGPEARRTLEQLAQGLFHADRSWPGLLKRGREAGLGEAALEACRRFVAASRVDQKRLDGLSLLRALRETGLTPL